MKITEDELQALGFQRAGSVHPDPDMTVRVQIDRDVKGFVVYAMVVNDEVKKFGIAGTKNSSFSQRMHSEFMTVRQVIRGPVPGRPLARWRSRPLDPFKQHAPATILANQPIELWALECPSFEAMMAKETELNNRYQPLWTKEGRVAARRSSGAVEGGGPE